MNKRQKKRKRKEDDNTSEHDENDLRYLELYSGVGGWTMALEEALGRLETPLKPKRIAALDHSDLCMQVFVHNFGSDRKSFQIERLTEKQVEKWKSKFWFMSPPCRKFLSTIYFHSLSGQSWNSQTTMTSLLSKKS